MNPAPPTSELAGLARIFWMMIGPMILVLLVMGVAGTGTGWFTGHDIAFLIVVAVTVLARWYEFRSGNPLASTGDPATPDVLRRYVVCVSLIGLGVWVVANVIGNHLLTE